MAECCSQRQQYSTIFFFFLQVGRFTPGALHYEDFLGKLNEVWGQISRLRKSSLNNQLN